MKKILVVLGFLTVFLPVAAQQAPKKEELSPEKPRLIVLTDYFKDPDDKQCLIRFLLYTNEFDVRGIIATSLAYGTGEVHPEWIKEMLDFYGMVRPNLLLHDADYPSSDSLKAVVKPGAKVVRKYIGPGKGFKTPFGRDSRTCGPATDYIGKGKDKDTEGSEHIIKVIDESSSPTWILVWGGAMDLAQALWKVRSTRDERSLAAFIKKIRYYQIHWQDTGATWLWEEFPGLFRIQGLDSFKGIYREKDDMHGNQAWVALNIRNGHGPLGAKYPVIEGIDGVKEGDSPSFLYLVPNGLSSPEKPGYGSWGGRFSPYKNRPLTFIDAMDRHSVGNDSLKNVYWTVARWNKTANLDFAARMDWCKQTFQAANHHPIVKLDHKSYLSAESGAMVHLGVRGTFDPDGDQLTYRWWYYKEASSYDGNVELTGAFTKKASFIAPSDIVDETEIHIICEVKDNGIPQLTQYQRVIVKIVP